MARNIRQIEPGDRKPSGRDLDAEALKDLPRLEKQGEILYDYIAASTPVMQKRLKDAGIDLDNWKYDFITHSRLPDDLREYVSYLKNFRHLVNQLQEMKDIKEKLGESSLAGTEHPRDEEISHLKHA